MKFRRQKVPTTSWNFAISNKARQVHSSSIPYHILNKSLETAMYFSDCWQNSFIKPIFKSGETSSVSNYRPITILSRICKLFESLIYNSLLYSFNSILIDQQFGFHSNSSPELNLLTYN